MVAILSLGITTLAGQRASAAFCGDNDNNAIVRCGFDTLANLPAAVQRQQAVTGDVNAVFAHFGLTDLNGFIHNATHVTVFKNGNVTTDDGTIIGTDAISYGRTNFEGNPNRHPITIKVNGADKTFYYSTTQVSFASNSISGFAKINDDHSMQVAILTSCANTVTATSPAYKCTTLNSEKLNDTSYNFSSNTPVPKNATVEKFIYDFGDGSPTQTTTTAGEKVNHVYAQPGNYTARVTVFFMANGKEVSDTRVDCTKQITIPKPKPIATCTGLTGQLIEGSRKYEFTATAHYENGAKAVSASFDFGDGQQASDLTNFTAIDANNAKITAQHQYADTLTGTQTIKATLTFSDASQKTVDCATTITLTAQTCAEKPNAPECQPPKQTCVSTECQPTKVPETGPAEVVGSMLGLSSVAGAGMYYRNSRRNLVDLILNKKR